jgi:NADPH:quinone reductase-like Zn-dependent oxidoreductase
MKAAFIERHGGPEVLKFGEMPDPVAASGEVVVDIVAASVNGADWKVREGKSGQLARFPYILGRDFSGVVSAVGGGVTDLSVGDEVFAVCDVGQEGAYAEKIAIKAAIVARKPAGVSHVDAAALALAGLTAICTIEDTLKLKAGETILIQGGAGGVASFSSWFFWSVEWLRFAFECAPVSLFVIASVAKQSRLRPRRQSGLLRRFAPRNDGTAV